MNAVTLPDGPSLPRYCPAKGGRIVVHRRTGERQSSDHAARARAAA